MHSHRCHNCGHVWEHNDDCFGDVQEHTCKLCGQQEWFKHHPNAPHRQEAQAFLLILEALLIESLLTRR